MKLLLMLVTLFLQPCLSGSTSFLLPLYPAKSPGEAENYTQYDDVTTLDVSLMGPEEWRHFESQTLQRLTSRMFKVRVTGPKSHQAFELMNCSVSDSPFIELGRLASQLNENGVELSMLITTTGRLGKTELPIDCAVDFSAECALDNDEKCNTIRLTIPLSVVRSEADKNVYSNLAHLLTGFSMLVVFCMSCCVTMKEVRRHLYGLIFDMFLCMAVYPSWMTIAVRHILSLPTNVQRGLMSIITSPYSCVTVTMIWVLQGNVVMGVVATTSSFLVSLLYVWVPEIGHRAPGIVVPHLLGFWLAQILIIILGSLIRSTNRAVAQRIKGMMFLVGPILIGYAAVMYFYLLSIYAAIITKGMFLAPAIYLCVIGVIFSISCLVIRRDLITSQGRREQVRCLVLCALLRDDMSAYLVFDHAPEEDDISACHTFVFTFVTLVTGLLLCVVRLVCVIIQRYPERGILWFLPDHAPVDEQDSDGGIAEDDSDDAADPGNEEFEMNELPQDAGVNENQDAAVNENQGVAGNENQDVAVNENQDVAVNENQDVAVDVNQDVAVNENQDVAVNENQDVAVIENQDVAGNENQDVAVHENQDEAVNEN